MNAPNQHDATHEPETTGPWWHDDYEDIFARAADTTRQERPGRVEVGAPPVSEASCQEPPPLPMPEHQPALSRMPVCVTAARTVRVLLADDDEVLRHIIGYQLAQLDWEVTCSADGVEVQRLLQAGQVDVLLVDLDLPHRNAYEILASLQGVPGAPRVIVMSEQLQEDKIVRAFRLGADDFVPKPINPRVVMSRIQRLMERG